MGQHVNTFNKGMTSDMNILYQPDGTYRYMKNCQLISQDGNNFVIKDCLGNVLIFELNIPYLDYGITTPATATYEEFPMAISFISFPDKLIVLSSNNKLDAGGYGEIGVLNFVNYGEGISPVPVAGNENNGYVPRYGHKDLNFSQMHRIEGFAYEESSEIQRIYWTDNNNEPRALNVGNPMFTTYINSGDLVDGTQYMVLEGIIEYPVASGDYYGPTNGTSNIISNVFTCVTPDVTYTNITGTSPTPKVVEYFPVELLDFAPNRLMGDIKFKNYGVGSVYCGTKMYFYRLSKPTEGIYTTWSYGAAPIHVGTENSVTAAPANPFFDFTGGGTSSVLLNSERSVVITVDNIDTNFSNIEVAVAEFDQSLEVIRQIVIIANETITGTSMDITHAGNSNLGELTLGDITLFPASVLKCKTLTTNKNYILIGNVNEREEFADFDTSNVTITQIQHKIRAHQSEYGAAGTAQVCENVLSYNIPTNSSVVPSTIANPATVDGIQPYTQWVVTTGVATYNAVTYGPAETAGKVFTGAVGVFNWTDTSGTCVVRPCVSKNSYTTQSSVKRPDYIEFAAADSYQWNYKNPAVASHVKGHWSNQTYRYGWVPFDLKGNPYYVRWLDDFTFDTAVNVPLMELVTVDSSGDQDWYLNQNGISIDGIEIPADLIDKISGFSIVRAERDATIMSQGMLMQVTYNAGGNSANTPSPNLVTGSGFSFTGNNGQLMTYVCPDKLVDYPVDNYVAGSKMSLSHWVIPRTVFGANMKASSDSDATALAFETKYFEVAAAEGAGTKDPDPNKEILAIQDMSENSTITNFGPGNWSYINCQGFAAAGLPTVENACGAAGSIASSGSAGGPRTLIEIDGSFYGYNLYPGTNYGDVGAVVTNLNKMMTNVTVEKTSLYGGQSPEALANTFYISVGHFQPITTAVKADTFDGVDKYIFDEIEIYGGDCYNCLITYGHSLAGVAPPFTTSGADPVHSWGIKFACQCNSNYDLRRGRLVEAVRMYPATAGVNYTTPQLEGFSYNKGYSSTGLAFLYPALPTNFSISGQFKFRIRYGGQKFPGETIDSFRVFNSLDFKDTDGQGGEINNLKTKDGRTIVWQNKIVSSVPILERQLLSGTDGADTTIGTGGVVDRFDPITSAYGNQHQWSLTEAEYGFFWFDMRNKAFMAFGFGAGIQEISEINGLKAYFSELFLEVLGNTANSGDVVNSQTFAASSDRPLLGVGITGAYDPKFKMSYLTFKFYSREDFSGGLGTSISNIAQDITIGYYHPTKAFVGFFDWTPAIAHTHNQTLFSVKNPQNKEKYYGASMASTTFAISDVVSYLNSEYMCISPVTIASYPGTATQVPGYVGSIYWYRINTTREIWAQNQPAVGLQNPAPDYLYSSFFGQPVDGEVWIVIAPKSNNPFSVLNIEQQGNNVYPTQIDTETDALTASDTNITSTNRNYRVIYNSLTSSLPLSSKGIRLTDSYLLIKIKKQNWSSTAPYTMNKSPKILEMLKSFFEEKR